MILEPAVKILYGFGPRTLLIMYSVIGMLWLFGVLGNLVSIVIWTKPNMKSSPSILLTALAVCDLLILLTSDISLYISVFYINYHESSAISYMFYFINPFIGVYLRPVYHIALIASKYLTLAITIDRYIAVRHPFRARRICNYSRACKYALAIIIASILYNLPTFLAWKVSAKKDKNGEIKSYKVSQTELYAQSSVLRTIYNIHFSWLYVVINLILPFICISILNTLIYIEMKKMEKRRMTMTATQREENQVTIMLVYVVIEFLVCTLVDMLAAITRTLEHSGFQLGFNRGMLRPLASLFETINSSSNILTYVVFGSKFRETLLTTFCYCSRFCPLNRPFRTENLELDLGAP